MIILLFLSIIFILKIIDRLFPIFPKQRISQSLYKFSKKKKENKKKGKNKHDFLKKKKKKKIQFLWRTVRSPFNPKGGYLE